MTMEKPVSLSQAIEGFLNKYFDDHEHALPPPGLYDRVIKAIEEPLVRVTLTRMSGNQQKTAALLGMSRNTLRKKIEILKI